MNTDELIRTLAEDTRRVTDAGAWRVAGALIAGGFVALLAIDALFGPPLRAVAATGVMVFAVKLAYAVSMTAVVASLLLVAGRPGQRFGLRYLWLLAPPLEVAAAAAMELGIASPHARAALVLGSTWQTSLISVVAMSVPVFAALIWSFRRLAPTRLRLAGCLAGLCSGAMASLVYALYCTETALSFLLVWYSLGMVVPGIAGALLGPRVLRW
ncbi:MAG: DUF1109 domain-containing protein [Pseudorhodoplanes sp.]|uniref:DUF1109 domain-containing protein n=1 Tax=Pseudorhodoplanes sp. TaxID=1934341 RepID=UPI003D1135C4